ncbi:helix-turn-helix transcriptional regulator [Pelagicoccus albus]|uniref:WYL domain-containing protein n=1 Tax=Pelagicoccus albus TaxID=415222 RepID=A0A7X1B4T7_9BACT|nr:WYL domain-containing protein [Pelagicoccus albus]MBC2605636.1 WYL domain-containing protein [Pelagicoccus albus]
MQKDAKIHTLKRPAIERMLRIHNELKANSYPNCTSLSKQMEVSTKTISRDIDFMRDRMLLPVDYDAIQHGFYYTREVQSLPTIDISEGELLALSIARKAMDHYKGTPFERPLSNALNKLAANLPDTITANLDELSESISFRQGRSSQIDDTILNAFTRSVLDKTEIGFVYRKLGAKTGESRTLKTYHLTNFLGKWYAIGLDSKRQAIRTFLLNRVESAELRSETFSVPKSFSADDYLGSSFGIYSPVGDHDIKVHFQNPISEYIAENTWHPSQSVEYHKDGTVTIGFKLSNLTEVTSWILSWGANAKVVQPKELKKQIKSIANKVAQLY